MDVDSKNATHSADFLREGGVMGEHIRAFDWEVDPLGPERHPSMLGDTEKELLDHFKPQLVLLDIGMPEMDGHEVARRIRRKNLSGIKLVAVTGWGQEEDRQRTKDSGFDFHLVKPISIKDVESLVARDDVV